MKIPVVSTRVLYWLTVLVFVLAIVGIIASGR